MATITLKGNEMTTIGDLPQVGASLPNFTLIGLDLTPITKADFPKQKLLLNIFPSVDTPVCSSSVKAFNEKASSLDGVSVLCVSKDLPFAQNRFCGAEGVENVEMASAFRSDSFGKDFGVLVTAGALEGLFARAIVVADASGKVIYQELVPEIAQEPNYEAALAAVKG